MPSEIERIAEQYAERYLERWPTAATTLGDRRYDDRLPEGGPQARAEDERWLRDLQRQVGAVDRSGLDGEDAISHHMLGLVAEYGLANLEHRLHQLGVDQMGGPQVSLATLLNWHTLQSERNARDLLARWRQVPRYMDQHVADLQEGVAAKRTSPQVSHQRVLAQLDTLLATAPEASPYGRAAAKAPALKDALLAAVREHVYPAFTSLRQYLASEYRPRPEPGIWCIPDGEQTYQELVRQATQSELSPEQVHDIGLEELRSIHAEMAELGVRDVAAHSAKLKADPTNGYPGREALMADAQRLFDMAHERLPRFFALLPKTPCRVIALEEYREKDAPAAYYFPPAQDGSRPGTYYVNTYRPETRPRYNLPALTVHEAEPGHHTQIAIQHEAEATPRFRRHRMGTHFALVAFTEGWGLYSERVGDEMEMYGTPQERFGMLSYQAWRAARLVVDTGMHALRWPRERAVSFLLDNVGLPENEVLNEIDRYIAWPAQALAYKMGQRHFETLRRNARDRLSSGFDVREFHAALLRHGAVPLTTATFAIERWVDQVRAGAGSPEAPGTSVAGR